MYIVRVIRSNKLFRANTRHEIDCYEKETGLQTETLNAHEFISSLEKLPFYSPKPTIEDYLLD